MFVCINTYGNIWGHCGTGEAMMEFAAARCGLTRDGYACGKAISYPECVISCFLLWLRLPQIGVHWYAVSLFPQLKHIIMLA